MAVGNWNESASPVGHVASASSLGKEQSGQAGHDVASFVHVFPRAGQQRKPVGQRLTHEGVNPRLAVVHAGRQRG
jgi:hypothetical protein